MLHMIIRERVSRGSTKRQVWTGKAWKAYGCDTTAKGYPSSSWAYKRAFQLQQADYAWIVKVEVV